MTRLILGSLESFRMIPLTVSGHAIEFGQGPSFGPVRYELMIIPPEWFGVLLTLVRAALCTSLCAWCILFLRTRPMM
jgi:hypothetical protein